jgi:hypothetical protein
MRKLITLVALVALVSCDSATGAERATGDAPPSQARSVAAASVTTTSTIRVPTVHIRRKVAGTPGLYAVRALMVDGGEVTVEVRKSTTAFLNLNSGSLETVDVGTGVVDLQFQTAAGMRYMVVAYPSVGGVVDPTSAAFVDAVP